MYHGLDGALAARALAALGARESVPVLVEAFKRIDPELKRVAGPLNAGHPLAWADVRAKMYLLPALGDLPCDASKDFLQWYVGLEESAAQELAPLFYEDATRAFFRQRLTKEEIDSLLASPRSPVRGVAILECLDRPSPERTAALRERAPWAVE
jgi:hypothetical protein